MKKGPRSSLMLTATTKHSQQLYDTCNSKTRSRLNLLATTGSTQLRYPNTYQTLNPQQPKKPANINAKLAKIAFQIQLCSQDLQLEQQYLKVSNKYLNKIRHMISKNTSSTFTNLSQKLIELEGGFAKHVNICKERTKQLNNEMGLRKEKFEHVKEKMGLLGIRIKRIEDAVGTYTGNDKMQFC